MFVEVGGDEGIVTLKGGWVQASDKEKAEDDGQDDGQEDGDAAGVWDSSRSELHLAGDRGRVVGVELVAEEAHQRRGGEGDEKGDEDQGQAQARHMASLTSLRFSASEGGQCPRQGHD